MDSFLGAAGSPPSGRARRALLAGLVVLALGLGGYLIAGAPANDGSEWKPPAGVRAEDTPHWLRTLCAKDTPELCAAADRARNPADCDAMRAALRSLEDVERKLTAADRLAQRQRWVLAELYGQGHELCQFTPGERR